MPTLEASRRTVGKPDKLNQLTSYLLNRISHRYNQTILAQLKDVGLTTTSARVIVCLKVHGELTINELCVHAIAEQPAMSRALDRMEEEQLVSRHVGDRDSRVRVIRLTAEGEALYDKIWPTMAIANEELLQGISQQDRDAFMRVLTQILVNIRQNPF